MHAHPLSASASNPIHTPGTLNEDSCSRSWGVVREGPASSGATATQRLQKAIGRRTPTEAFAARTKAMPKNPPITAEGHHRVRQDRIDKAGCVTLRYRSKLLHIGVGRVHAGVRMLLLVNDLDVRVITEDGELLRQLTLDRTKTYQPHRPAQGPGPVLTLSSMSPDICPGCLATQHGGGGPNVALAPTDPARVAVDAALPLRS